MLYTHMQGHHEASVKRGLSVCTELWRRQIWRDARTVNVIAAATQHQSIVVMLAALKFFLGQDLAAEVDDGDKEEEGDDVNAPPSKTEVYRTYHKVCCYLNLFAADCWGELIIETCSFCWVYIQEHDV